MKKKMRITADANLLEELIQELQEAGETVSLERSDKKLTGADVVSVIADLTTIGVGIVAAWQAMNKAFKSKIDVKEIEPAPHKEDDVEDDFDRQSK